MGSKRMLQSAISITGYEPKRIPKLNNVSGSVWILRPAAHFPNGTIDGNIHPHHFDELCGIGEPMTDGPRLSDGRATRRPPSLIYLRPQTVFSVDLSMLCVLALEVLPCQYRTSQLSSTIRKQICRPIRM